MDMTRLAVSLLESVPANRTFGIEVLHAADGQAEVALDTAPEFHNVIGSLHCSGLAALVDATGLAAVIAAATGEGQLTDVTPLGSGAQLRFLAPARGRLIGRCGLEPEALRALRALFEGPQQQAQIDTLVEVYDGDETIVCEGSFTWKIRRRRMA